uniref:Uncharacterized protein n=1 Tax=Brassica oleracea TaxID=3712 RepID=A0A3P6FAJ1_BRAOL|nr:unnamed protein product [Brassica oleracea]
MGSRSESDEHFMFDPEYSPPNIVDLETHEVLASLAAAEEFADQIAEVLLMILTILMLKSLHQPVQPQHLSLAERQLTEQPRGNPCSNPL